MHVIPYKRSALATAAFLACCTAAAQTAGNPADTVTELQAVTVKASADASAEGLPAPYAGGQVARGGRVGMLGNVDNMDTPFSSTSYTQALIQDQQARSVGDVLLNDPTVRVARGFGNYQELYMVRGFPVNSDDLSYNGLYGILPRQFVATELLERVEVLRGANTFLNGATMGNSGIGGTINLLPKRAPNEPLTQVTAGTDSGGQHYLATDLARRFGPDQSSGIRINAARRDGDTAIDDEERELNLFSVGLDHHGRNYRLSADVGYQQHKLRQARPSVTLAAGVPVPDAPDASSNFAQPWSYSDERDVFGTLRGEFDLAPDVTVWAAAGMRRGTEENSLATPSVINGAGDTSAYRFDNSRRDKVRTGEIGIRGKLRTGAVGHSLSAVASTQELKSRNAYALSSFAGFASNLYSPIDVARPAATAVVSGDLSDPGLVQRTELSSIALADTLSFADDRVLLTVGARRQSIKDKSYNGSTGAESGSYDKSTVTPMAGLVVKPMKNVSLYANYIEGLVKGGTAPETAGGVAVVNAGEIFSPYRSRQKEIGAKYDAGSFGMNVSLFTISQPMAMVDTATGIYGTDGEQRNRGVEFTLYGTPARGVRLLGGLTFLDAKQRNTEGGANDGNDVIGVPGFQANLGAEWDIPGVKGLSVNGKLLHTASQYVDAANTQKIPSWNRLDVGARYVASIGKQMVTIRGQIENLTNRDYWASAGGYPGYGYLVLGAPRTFVLSASLDF